MKSKTQFLCQQCGHASPKWIGRCPSCQQWNTFAEEQIATGDTPSASLTWDSSPVLFGEISGAETCRISTGIDEFDRVLGGGLVPGALVLLGGDPGVGKSTLMLQISRHVAQVGGKVLYVSGEESFDQTRLRARRLGALESNVLILTGFMAARLPRQIR